MPPLYNAITNLRKDAAYIKFLTLSANHVGLDFDALIDAMHTNSTLQRVYCHDKFLEGLTSSQIKTLMEACATLPQLQELSVSLPPNRTHLSALVVQQCVARTSSPQLGKLVLRGFDRPACVALAACLPRLPSLVNVQLLDGCEKPSCGGVVSVLAGALADPNTRVRNLVVSSFHGVDNGDIAALAEALGSNQELETLDMRSSTSSDSESAATNYEPLVRQFQAKQNETLRTLQTDAAEPVQETLHFFTQLNASGASRLLRRAESASNEDWLGVLEQQKEGQTDGQDDLNVLFHTLSQYPSFLLSYSSTHDRQAHKRPFQRKQRARSVTGLDAKALSGLNEGAADVSPRKKLSPRRKKPVRAPSCFALNLPW